MTTPLFDVESVGPAAAAAREVTFLHTADWQLGMTRRFLAGEAQHRYAAARLDAVRRIGELAASSGAEFVVVCGDVFESPQVPGQVVRRALDALGDYPVPVYLLPGNHDPLDAASIYRSPVFTRACPDNVVVLDRPGAFPVRDGVTLVASPWTTKRPLRDLVAQQINQLGPSDGIRIVVGHGGLDVHSPNPDPAIVRSAVLDVAVAAGHVDYVALGDRHSLTPVGDSERIWYPGAPEVTNFDHVEGAPGQVLEVTLGGGRRGAVSVTPHRVGRWAFLTIREECHGRADLERLRARLEAVPDKPCTVVQLALTGAVSVAEQVLFEGMLDDFRDRFAAVQLWDRQHDLAVVAEPTDVAALALGGYAAQAAEELIARCSDDADPGAAAARSALVLLHRLAGAPA